MDTPKYIIKFIDSNNNVKEVSGNSLKVLSKEINIPKTTIYDLNNGLKNKSCNIISIAENSIKKSKREHPKITYEVLINNHKHRFTKLREGEQLLNINKTTLWRILRNNDKMQKYNITKI